MMPLPPPPRPPLQPDFEAMQPHQRKRAEKEFKEHHKIWRRQMDDWENSRKWDEAAMIVVMAVVMISVVLFFVIGSYYAAGGIRGPLVLIAGGLMFLLAVVEVKKRL